MNFKKIINKIAPYILAGSIAFNAGACGNYNTFKPGSIPSNKAEISAVVAGVEKARESCRDINSENCDKQGYLQGLAKLAGYELNKKGYDISNLDFTYDNSSMPDEIPDGAGAAYRDDPDFIWVNLGTDKLKEPKTLIPFIYHETGHRVQVKDYGKSKDSESVSTFFEKYFLAESIADGALPAEYVDSWSLFNKSYNGESCDLENPECRYELGNYTQLKHFGKNKGNFNATLDDLAGFKSARDCSDEFKNDVSQELNCEYILEGTSAYKEMLKKNNVDVTNLGDNYCRE